MPNSRDNGCFRAYYVIQKDCKWCLKAQRAHRSTYGQLYLTYKSIKYRCYSNDCHEQCLCLSWDVTERCRAIRGLLFADLSAAELENRYGELLRREGSTDSSSRQSIPDESATNFNSGTVGTSTDTFLDPQ